MSFSPRPDGTARLMLFFAVVYAVEGIGQAKSGIVWQPLSHFLKEARGWNPVEISRVAVGAGRALGDQAAVWPDLGFPAARGYRRRSYLLLAASR